VGHNAYKVDIKIFLQDEDEMVDFRMMVGSTDPPI